MSCQNNYNVFNDNLVQEYYCNRPTLNHHLHTMADFAHTPQVPPHMQCQTLETYQKVGLGYKRDIKEGFSDSVKAVPMGLPVGCNNRVPAARCDIQLSSGPEAPPNYTFNSTKFLKFLDCMPANTRLAVEDPYNPITFMTGCPYNPNCRCGSGRCGGQK